MNYADLNATGIRSTKVWRQLWSYRHRPFLVVESSGNPGDHLIWRGGNKLIRLAGIQARGVRWDEFLTLSVPPDHVVYIHGGGVFSALWDNSSPRAMAHAARTHRGPVIFGPSSFMDDPAYLRRAVTEVLTGFVCESVTLYARDLKSADIVSQFIPAGVRLDVDHDTALNLTAEDLGVHTLPRRYRLYALRRDAEAAGQLALNPFALCLDPVKECRDFEQWVRLHAHAREVITNRLHSSIVASILGLPTTLLPNAYHKNRALWEYSLQDRGVHWADTLPAAVGDHVFRVFAPLTRWLRRRRGLRAIRFLHGATRRQLFATPSLQR